MKAALQLAEGRYEREVPKRTIRYLPLQLVVLQMRAHHYSTPCFGGWKATPPHWSSTALFGGTPSCVENKFRQTPLLFLSWLLEVSLLVVLSLSTLSSQWVTEALQYSLSACNFCCFGLATKAYSARARTRRRNRIDFFPHVSPSVRVIGRFTTFPPQ